MQCALQKFMLRRFLFSATARRRCRFPRINSFPLNSLQEHVNVEIKKKRKTRIK